MEGAQPQDFKAPDQSDTSSSFATEASSVQMSEYGEQVFSVKHFNSAKIA